MSTVTLFHGTTKENYEMIKKDGFLHAPVYMTPNKTTAEDYAANNSANYAVFEVDVEYSELEYDSECVCSHSVEESLDAGSVYVDRNVCIARAIVTHYNDYCETEQ